MNNQQIIKLALTLPNDGNKYAWIVDFERLAKEHRFFMIDLEAKKVYYSWFTSHGSGSGPLERCEKTSNIPNSRMSSHGLVKCAEIYTGKYGRSLALDGLESSNDKIRQRHIVIHASDYVNDYYMKTHVNPGRSWGCITQEPHFKDNVINKLQKTAYGYIIPPKS